MEIRDAICWLLEEQRNAPDVAKESYEQIMTWLTELDNIKSIIGGRFDLMCDHDLSILESFITALSQSKAWILPCAPGDDVFCIVWRNKKPEIYVRPFKVEWAFDVGRTVFLDYDSAKTALEAIEGRRNEKL